MIEVIVTSVTFLLCLLAGGNDKSGDISSWQSCVWRRWWCRRLSDSVASCQAGVEAKLSLVFPLLSSLGNLCGCSNNCNIETRKIIQAFTKISVLFRQRIGIKGSELQRRVCSSSLEVSTRVTRALCP